MCERDRKAVIEFLFKDTFFKELFDFELFDAKFKPLRRLGLDTLEKLLSLSRENALKISYIGRKTYFTLRELKEQYPSFPRSAWECTLDALRPSI